MWLEHLLCPRESRRAEKMEIGEPMKILKNAGVILMIIYLLFSHGAKITDWLNRRSEQIEKMLENGITIRIETNQKPEPKSLDMEYQNEHQ